MQTNAVSAPDWWSTQGAWVETPNYDRDGFSGVQSVVTNGARYFIKRQSDYLFRSLRYPRGRPTLLREFRNFQTFNRLGLNTPEVACFDMRRDRGHWEAVLVTQALDGYLSLHDGLLSSRWNAEQRVEVFKAVSQATTLLHRQRRKHGHLYPKEIFINDQGNALQVAFLDLELSRRCLTPVQAATSDLKRFFKRALQLGMTRYEFQQFVDSYVEAGINLPPRIAVMGCSPAYTH